MDTPRLEAELQNLEGCSKFGPNLECNEPTDDTEQVELKLSQMLCFA